MERAWPRKAINRAVMVERGEPVCGPARRREDKTQRMPATETAPAAKSAKGGAARD